MEIDHDVSRAGRQAWRFAALVALLALLAAACGSAGEELSGRDYSFTLSPDAVGTDVTVTFDEPTEHFDTHGFAAVGREGELGFSEAEVTFIRPTGYASRELLADELALPLFTETFDTWLSYPEVNVLSSAQVELDGQTATMVRFVIDATAGAAFDCGDPLYSCIHASSTPNGGPLASTTARTGRIFIAWEVDQGAYPPLVITASSPVGDNDWLEAAERAVSTIELGEPAPAPQGFARRVAAGEVVADVFGGHSLTTPEPALVFQGSQCTIVAIPDDRNLTGLGIAHVTQTVSGEPVETLEDYLAHDQGALTRTETGRTMELFGTTLVEHAFEETGSNENGVSCVGQDADPLDAPAIGVFGLGAEWLAEAEGGGVYLVAWALQDPTQGDIDEISAMYEDVIATIQSTE